MKTSFFTKYISPIVPTFKRFPIASALFACIAIMLCIIIIGKIEDQTPFFRLIVSAEIIAIISISIHLLAEKYEKPLLQLLHIPVILYGVFTYIWWNLHTDFLITILLQIPAFISMIFWVGNKKSKNDEHFYNNFLHIIRAILLGLGVGIISTILGSIAIFSVQNLFDLSYEFSKWASAWMAICITFFAPTYSLSQFPDKNEHSAESFEDGGKTGFFTKYIFLPFTCLYAVILYAYSLKVLINFSEWPKGSIVILVIGFSLLGYFTYILAKSSNSANIQKFRKFLPFVIFPQIFMLFYAIYLRIAQYGLTTSRYLVVISGIILLGLSLYYIFSKKKSIIAIPATFSIFAIIFSFGPWGIHYLPQKLQFESLKKLMTETKMYENGKFSPYNLEKFGTEKQKLIYGKMQYLCNYNSCDKDFYAFIEPAIQTYDKPIFQNENKRQNPSHDFYEKMNLVPIINSSYAFDENGKEQPLLTINNPKYLHNTAIRVTGFDYYFEFSGAVKSIENTEITHDKKGIIVKINNESHKISLENFIKKIQQNNGQNLSEEDFEIVFENEKILAKIAIQNIFILNGKDPKINDIYGNILIKIK